jgi:hypothetical protein
MPLPNVNLDEAIQVFFPGSEEGGSVGQLFWLDLIPLNVFVLPIRFLV